MPYSRWPHFDPDHYVSDFSGFQRGDRETRWDNNKIALETGAMTINDVRQEEGYNPIASGGARRR